MLIETLSVFPEMFEPVDVHIDFGPRPQGRPF